MKWAVEIQKTNLERRNLDDLLNGLRFTLVDGIQYPAFTSHEIDNCDTAPEVFERAKQLRAAFTGPAQIDPTFTLGPVIDYTSDPPKRHYFLEVESGVMKMSGGAVTLTISPSKDLSADELEKWKKEQAEKEYQAKLESQRARFEPAYLNPNAAKMLELLASEEPSAQTLYKIYELAEGHPTNRSKFQKQFGITKDQFDRFRDAIHNPKVTGGWARHAYEDPPRTSNPMSKEEAEKFIRQIAYEWLEHIRRSSTR
jgi:hypothetical protein